MAAELAQVDGKTFDAVVIGSGFGGSVAVTRLLEAGRSVLVIERGTWWGNPEGPALKPAKKPLAPIEGRQWWPRPNDSRGLVYVLESVYKEVNPLYDVLNPLVTDNDLGLRANRRGLYRLTRFTHAAGKVDVVSASAVGGGSLIYSGVNLIATKPVLDRVGLSHLTSAHFQGSGRWMKKNRGRINKISTKIPVPHRAGTEYQLSAIPESGDPKSAVDYEMPDPAFAAADLHEKDYVQLDRSRVLERAKKRVDASGGFRASYAGVERVAEPSEVQPLPLSVVEYDPTAAAQSSKTHAYCSRDGRCITGCLPSARHTLYKLLEQQGSGVAVIAETKVSHLARRNGKYAVELECFQGDSRKRGQVFAGQVFVAAGCLGTSEILLRTRKRYEETGGTDGLPLAPTVGTGFSTNGDSFGFATGVGDPKGSEEVPDAERIGKPNPTVGPINTTGFHLVYGKGGASRIDVHIEDAGVPSMFARLVHELLPAFGGDFAAVVRVARAFVRSVIGNEPFDEAARPRPTDADQVAYQTEHQLISDLFFFNAMGAGPDEPLGTFYLDDNRTMQLRYETPLHRWSVFDHIQSALRQLSDKMHGTYVASPFFQNDGRITVTHPLGGCPIGSDRATGALDPLGRLYDTSAASPTAVLEGLYVVDAAAIGGALGVNPTFTIVAQANYVMDNALA